MAIPDYNYSIPGTLHATPPHLLDLRPNAEIDAALLNPPPISDSELNIWFFWHTGYPSMHPYTQRNIRAYYRRFSPLGWVVRVLDRVPESPLNVSNFLDVNDLSTFPAAFTQGTIAGRYAVQHTSDLVRWPLLLRHGGVYADVGLLQIGDLDRLWRATVGNPASPYDVLSYDDGSGCGRGLANYFLCSSRSNPLFARCHALLLKLWEGRTHTEGMHSSPLLAGVPAMGGSYTIDESGEGGEKIGEEETGRLLTDYIIQGQAMSAVMNLVDEEGSWDGPKYVKEHVYGIEFMAGAQLINELTKWDGQLAFELLSLRLPSPGEEESEEQKRAREIVESVLTRSFSFKLAHGMILRVFKATLGSLWREYEGSDDVPGTYAHWLRYAMVYWNQDEVPPPVEYRGNEPYRVGRLLG